MKKLIAFLLAAALLCTAASAAEPLRVIDGWNIGDEYLERYPERAMDELEIVYDNMGDSNQNKLLFSGEWDVAVIETIRTDLASLCEAIPLLDLTTVDAQRAETMFPAIKEALTIDGALRGLPLLVFGCTMTLKLADEETLTGLGMNAVKQPETFAELAALAEDYMALPRETRRGTAFNVFVRDNWTAYYLNYLIDCYQAQCVNGEGGIDFDTPVFRENLVQIERLNTALCIDRKTNPDENGALKSVIDDYGNGMMNDSCSVLHVREEDDAIPATMFAVIVNANSPRIDEALDFVHIALETAEETEMLYESFDYDARLHSVYDELIDAQIEQQEAQEVIDRLAAQRDAGDPVQYYSREEIQEYAENIAPKLSFPCYRRIYAVDAIANYTSGKLDADGLIQELNRLSGER